MEGAPPLQAAQMMEPPTLDAEQAIELTLGSQLWPCSVNLKLAERRGRLTEDPKQIKGILHVWLSTHLSFNLLCDRCLKEAEGNCNSEMQGDFPKVTR